MDEIDIVLMHLHGITPEEELPNAVHSAACPRSISFCLGRQEEIEREEAGSSGGEPKQSGRVEEIYRRLLKCTHHLCLLFLHTVSLSVDTDRCGGSSKIISTVDDSDGSAGAVDFAASSLDNTSGGGVDKNPSSSYDGDPNVFDAQRLGAVQPEYRGQQVTAVLVW